MLGPLDGAGDGPVVLLLDPTGAALWVWETGDRGGAQVVGEPGAWAMSSLHTPDPARASAFYEAVFGWRPEPLPGVPITLLRLPGYVGGQPGQAIPRDVVAVMATTPDPAIPSHRNVNLRVDDADVVAARAAEFGGGMLAPPADTPASAAPCSSIPKGPPSRSARSCRPPREPAGERTSPRGAARAGPGGRAAPGRPA